MIKEKYEEEVAATVGAALVMGDQEFILSPLKQAPSKEERIGI